MRVLRTVEFFLLGLKLSNLNTKQSHRCTLLILPVNTLTLHRKPWGSGHAFFPKSPSGPWKFASRLARWPWAKDVQGRHCFISPTRRLIKNRLLILAAFVFRLVNLVWLHWKGRYAIFWYADVVCFWSPQGWYSETHKKGGRTSGILRIVDNKGGLV